MPEYLEKIEDVRFTEKVIRFNSLEDGEEKAKLQEQLEKRVSILLYEIPRRFLFLNHNDATDIFLDCVKDICTIISSYKVAFCTFNEYLTQICRYRMFNINRKRTRESTYRNAELEDASFELSERYRECEEIHEQEPVYYHSIARPDIYGMNLPELIEYIVQTRDGDTILCTAEEMELHHMMENKKKRRRLMIYLLSFPDNLEDSILNSIARILELDSSVLYRFMELRFELYEDSRNCHRDFLDKAGKQWLIMTKLRYAIEIETDKEQKDKLVSRYWKTAQYHNNNLCKAKNLKHISKQLLSEKLSLSRSTVALSCSLMEHELKDINRY